MGTFELSTGERMSKANIDANIRHAKSLVVSQAQSDDRVYCWSCGSTRDRLTCSHIISVNKCQNDGMAEWAWKIENIELLCIRCHVQTELRNYEGQATAKEKMRVVRAYEFAKKNKI